MCRRMCFIVGTELNVNPDIECLGFRSSFVPIAQNYVFMLYIYFDFVSRGSVQVLTKRNKPYNTFTQPDGSLIVADMISSDMSNRHDSNTNKEKIMMIEKIRTQCFYQRV